MLADPAVLRKLGYNEKEVSYLSKNPYWGSGVVIHSSPYLDKFKDEYQPFSVGYDDLDKMTIADIYKKGGASETALNMLGGKNTSALFELWRAPSCIYAAFRFSARCFPLKRRQPNDAECLC